VRLNSANRSFFTLVAAALVPYGLLGLFGCGLLSVVGYRLAADGFAGLQRGGQDLRPAALFFAAVATGTIVAGRSIHRQMAATRELSAAVAARTVPLAPAVEEASIRVGLTGRVDVIDDEQPYSFTYGLGTPRVAVSSGLVDAVGTEELAAVLHHERYHVDNADTLKVVVARAAPPAFFFLPALRHLRDRYLAGRELAADRAAVRGSGDRALAGALFKTLEGPVWIDLGAAAALGGGVLEHRVEQLEDGREPPLPRVPRRERWLTAAGLVALVLPSFWR
jgi:beta-lactamase regulating signal transducer with metallopeptidase domain